MILILRFLVLNDEVTRRESLAVTLRWSIPFREVYTLAAPVQRSTDVALEARGPEAGYHDDR